MAKTAIVMPRFGAKMNADVYKRQQQEHGNGFSKTDL